MNIQHKAPVALALAGLVALSGCAAQPKDVMINLNRNAPEYTSAECVQARQAALDYNDNVAGRMGLGLVMGLLGPVGLIGAVALDANQNSERDRVNAIVRQACSPAASKATETTTTSSD